MWCDLSVFVKGKCDVLAGVLDALGLAVRENMFLRVHQIDHEDKKKWRGG
jgi:hypothetical protein